MSAFACKDVTPSLCTKTKGHWARLRTTLNWVHLSREAHNKAYMWNLKLAALSKVCITV